MTRPLLLAAALFVLLSAHAAREAHADANLSVLYRGHSGIWYDPDRDGEGYVLELIGPDAATLTWFTYDDQGNQRWLVGLGEVVHGAADGTYLVFSELYDTSGGVFGEAFDPDLVERRLVGSARIAFDDCSSGRLSYDAYGASASVPVRRVATTMGLDCAPWHGAPDAKVGPHAGHSGSWYDPTHSGEGFQLQWNGSDQALLFWYSYDAAGRQYWMTGVGSRQGDGRVVFPSLTATRGARFGAAFDPDDVERFHWGSLELALDCDAGEATYTSDIEGFAPGAQTLARLTGLLGVSCPWERVGLADLYEIELTQVPTELPSDGLPVSVEVFSIADDGTLIGASAHVQTGLYQLQRLAPDASSWEAMTDWVLGGAPFQISTDATSILVDEFSDPNAPFSTLLWRAQEGWTALTGGFQQSSSEAGSPRLTYVVGVGRDVGEIRHYPWIWSRATGHVMLPGTDEIRSRRPVAVSETGDIVVGYSVELDADGQMTKAGIHWHALGAPGYLRDALGAKLGAATICSADCRIVYGAGQAGYHEDHPFKRQAWVITRSGLVEYLDHVDDALLVFRGSPYGPRATTGDGSLMVGTYTSANAAGALNAESFLWTRLTGSIALRDVAVALDATIDRWDHVYAMDVTSDGSRVLLMGWRRPTLTTPITFRAVVLHLRPIPVGA